MEANPLNIIFAGTPEFAALALQALLRTPHNVIAVYTQPDRPAGRGRKLTASPVKQLAELHDIPVYQPPSLKSTEEQEKLRHLNADLMIVAAYGLILPEAVLKAPKLGCINIHASLLPRWRGAAPIQRAILAGDQTTGITIMQMNKGLDTGNMLYKAELPISDKDTSETLHDKLATLGGDALLATLQSIATLQAKAICQDDLLATYAEKISKEEAKINWQDDAIALSRQVRAYNPWPVAFTILGKDSLRIWAAEALEESTISAPGKIISLAGSGIKVATGRGVLRITQLQLPGGKVISSQDVINSLQHRFGVGTQLG